MFCGLVSEDCIISRRADVVWLHRSCDLTALNYYLWRAAVKDKCYADKPETIDALKDNIREAIGEKQLHTIDNVLKNWPEREGYCMASQGRHLNEIKFEKKFKKIFSNFFKHFQKTKGIWRTLYL